jgi:hypothetical protein
MTFKIDTDVPLPLLTGRMKYPWNSLTPGDSVLFEVPAEYPRILNAAYGYARRNNWKITTHVGPEGLRIWRME